MLLSMTSVVKQWIVIKIAFNDSTYDDIGKILFDFVTIIMNN